jgi:uncharacterized membrane protein YphA (DoxX/SURF4 family)
MKRQIVIEIISFLFIVLFVYAALMKLLDVEKFTAQLGQSPMLMPFANWIAWLVPSIELAIAGLLAVARLRIIGLYSAFTLMVIFTVYVGIILTYVESVPCSCGGILEKMGWTEHLIFNIVFVIFSVIGVALKNKQSNKHDQSTEIPEHRYSTYF